MVFFIKNTMTPRNYLKPEEITNEKARAFIDFNRQYLKNNELCVEVTCPLCESKREVLVAVIRYRRRIFTGICKYCARPAHKHALPLKPEEVNPQIWQYLDFDSQVFKRLFAKKKQRFLNALFIDVTCKQCHSVRQVQASSIRAHGQHFTTLCRGCVNKGENNPNWGGGKTFSSGGRYMRLKIFDTHPDFEMVKSMIREDNTILEHRLVMAQKLGRPLERWEEVHHIDNNGFNNSPDNLEVAERHEHHAITIAEAQVKKLRKKNEALKKRVQELEIQLRVALDSK